MTLTEKTAVRTLVGTNVSDDVFTVVWAAADRYVVDRVTWTPPADDPDAAPPAPLVEAVVLMTARLLARRNAPTGMLGIDELGAMTIPSSDADVNRLIAPYRPVVFG